MIHKTVDVLVHVDEALDPAGQALLDFRVRQLDGVSSVRIPPRRPHLMLVEYNPALVSSQQILASVKQLWWRAKLVGM